MKVIILEKDYADEFNTYGFATFTDKKFEEFIDRVKNHKYPYTYGFGTNEEHEFFNAQEYLDSIRVVDITEEEHKIIEKVFSRYSKYNNNTF